MNEAPRSVIVAAEGQTRLRRSLGRRLWRVPVVAVSVVVMCLGIGSGVAWAFLTATASGTGTVTLAKTATTISLSTITGTTDHQIFTGQVTGVANHGYPTGTVTVIAHTNLSTTTTTICTTPITVGADSQATFSCTSDAATLTTGSYTVRAHYSGGKSSPLGYLYSASTSTRQSLTVT